MDLKSRGRSKGKDRSMYDLFSGENVWLCRDAAFLKGYA